MRVTVDISERDLARAQARLAKWQGRPFQQRMDAIFRAGTGLTVRPMRGAMSASGVTNRTGKTARSISVRKRRPPYPYFVQHGAKPRTRQTHLLTQGHRIVTRHGRDTGLRARAFPFVEATIRSHERTVLSFIERNATREGVSVAGLGAGSIGGFM